MRIVGRSLWGHLVALCVGFWTVPWCAMAYVVRHPHSDGVGILVIGVLLLFLPAWTAGVALWDGAVRGFSVLWLAAPPAVFLLPMLTVFNSSAAIYGILYALIGGVFSGIGHLGVYRVRRQPVSEDEGTPLRAQ